MLPHESLAPWYEKVVWLYVCRTWREDEPDREAARIHDRFGVTSWPHLFLIDPRDDAVLERVGRTVQALESAFAAGTSKVAAPGDVDAKRILDAARAARNQVVMLERFAEEPVPEHAEGILDLLQSPDVLVRHRAVVALRKLPDPPLAPYAETLLLEGNDPIRFEVLDWAQAGAVEGLTPVLIRLFREAGNGLPSGNPNVVRGRAAGCLVACGDARAIDALAPVAKAADARNTTTRTVVEALGAIGARGDAAARARAMAVVLEAWPAAVEPAANGQPTVAGRYALRLAEAVTAALGRLGGVDASSDPPPDPPAGWSEAERTAYVAAVTAWVRGEAGG